jgi:uncharacterized membrane protein YeaQ/YmgE (transglycosylase-associated protein family)
MSRWPQRRPAGSARAYSTARLKRPAVRFFGARPATAVCLASTRLAVPSGTASIAPAGLLGKEYPMNFIIWIVIGGVIGWIASIIMKTDAQQGLFLNVVVGIVGAMLGGWLISPLLGIGTINQNNFSLPSMLVSLVGAVILLFLVKLIRR